MCTLIEIQKQIANGYRYPAVSTKLTYTHARAKYPQNNPTTIQAKRTENNNVCAC